MTPDRTLRRPPVSREALATAGAALRKARTQAGALRGVLDDTLALARLVTRWARGEYREIPWRSIAAALGALAYFVNPIDVIPDALLGIGYLDDISVIAFVVNTIRSDLSRFQRWEQSVRRRTTRPQPVA